MSGNSLVEWADRQPEWVSDALRRIATSPRFSLSEEDRVAVQARVTHAAAAQGGAGPACEPLKADVVAGRAAPGARTVLVSLGPLTHVDRLASDQELRFALHGVTLVYGDNASGKSGYARVTKRLCRSLSSDPLKSNVFDPGGTPGAVVRFKVGEEDIQAVTWKDGDPSPAPLQQVSVFDTQNARLYVDEQNRIAYLPAELAILEQHGALCGTLNSVFDGELKALDRRVKTSLPGGYADDGGVSGVLKRIDPKAPQRPSKSDLIALATLSPDDLTERQGLEARLAQDPVVQAMARRRGAQVIQRLVEVLTPVEVGLSEAAGLRLSKLDDELRAAAAAEALAADAQFAAEPIRGVGGDAWRTLFDAARAFALGDEETAALPDAPDDLCALCQEPLGDSGAARLARFNAFVQSQAATVAKAARTAFNEARAAIEGLTIPAEAVVADQLAGYSALNDDRRAATVAIGEHLRTLSARRAALLTLGGGSSVTPTLAPPVAPASQLAGLSAEILVLTAEADALDAEASHSAGLDAARSRLADLKDREKLAHDLPVVLQRLEDVERIVLLKACQAQVATAGVSRQITTLRKALVTDDLQRRIAAEIQLLDLAHLPLRALDSSVQGQSRVAIGLHGVEKVPNSQVLSEGEQRALALACFLAEIADHGSGLIVDDPVSSLDHQRLRKVAARLVAEAGKGRQVIVFTHNIVFFNEVIAEAAKAGDAAPLHKAVIRKTDAAGYGVISEGIDPWVVREVKARLGDLRERAAQLAKVVDADEETRRAQAKDFYSDLRETWERAVEEVVFRKTVQRLEPGVMTQSLKGVSVLDEDYRTIFYAMKRVSERSGHDRALARDVPIPTAADMVADLEVLEAFRSDYLKRAAKLEEHRKTLEKPTPAELA